jgi:hypothetical protein
MAKYKKRPVLIEATQWFKNGDHPNDESYRLDTPDGPTRISEGKVVRYFKSLAIPGERICGKCGNQMQVHGELSNPHTGAEEFICPGDYILTDSLGHYYRMPAEEFETRYEPYRES